MNRTFNKSLGLILILISLAACQIGIKVSTLEESRIKKDISSSAYIFPGERIETISVDLDSDENTNPKEAKKTVRVESALNNIGYIRYFTMDYKYDGSNWQLIHIDIDSSKPLESYPKEGITKEEIIKSLEGQILPVKDRDPIEFRKDKVRSLEISKRQSSQDKKQEDLDLAIKLKKGDMVYGGQAQASYSFDQGWKLDSLRVKEDFSVGMDPSQREEIIKKGKDMVRTYEGHYIMPLDNLKDSEYKLGISKEGNFSGTFKYTEGKTKMETDLAGKITYLEKLGEKTHKVKIENLTYGTQKDKLKEKLSWCFTEENYYLYEAGSPVEDLALDIWEYLNAGLVTMNGRTSLPLLIREDKDGAILFISPNTEILYPDEKEPVKIPAYKTEKDLWEALNGKSFLFSGGDGNWQTLIEMKGGGDFVGEYIKTDSKNVEYLYFKGKFKVNGRKSDYSYGLDLEKLEFLSQLKVSSKNPEQKTIQVKEAYGFEASKSFDLYLPGSPVKELPQSYVKGAGLGGKTMEAFGLYNLDKDHAMVENQGQADFFLEDIRSY